MSDARVSPQEAVSSHSMSNPDFRFLIRLSGVATIEVPFDGAHSWGMIADPIFVDDNGAKMCVEDTDMITAVRNFAELHLSNLGWDWTSGDGGCGTVCIDVAKGDYQIEAYKRRVVMEAHIESGSLAKPLFVDP